MITSLFLLTVPLIFPPFDLGGVSIATYSINQAERVLGRGLPVTGAHADGARLWRLSNESNLVLYLDGVDSASDGGDDGYQLEDEVVMDGRICFPQEWRRAPVMKVAPGPFWTVPVLRLTELGLLIQLQTRGFQYRVVSGNEVDIYGTYQGELYYAPVEFNRNGHIKRVYLSLLIPQ